MPRLQDGAGGTSHASLGRPYPPWLILSWIHTLQRVRDESNSMIFEYGRVDTFQRLVRN